MDLTFEPDNQCYALTLNDERCKMKVTHEFGFCFIHRKYLNHGTVLKILQGSDDDFLITSYLVLLQGMKQSSAKDQVLLECIDYLSAKDKSEMNTETARELHNEIEQAIDPSIRKRLIITLPHEKCNVCWETRFSSIKTKCCAADPHFICSECWMELDACPFCKEDLPPLLNILLEYYDAYAFPNLTQTI